METHTNVVAPSDHAPYIVRRAGVEPANAESLGDKPHSSAASHIVTFLRAN